MPRRLRPIVDPSSQPQSSSAPQARRNHDVYPTSLLNFFLEVRGARIVLKVIAILPVPLTGPGPAVLLKQRYKFCRTEAAVVGYPAIRSDANTPLAQSLQHNFIDIGNRRTIVPMCIIRHTAELDRAVRLVTSHSGFALKRVHAILNLFSSFSNGALLRSALSSSRSLTARTACDIRQMR